MRNLTDETLLVEKFVISVLKGKGYRVFEHVSENNPQSSIDLIVDGKTIDVKYAYPTMVNRKRRTPQWDFDLRKGEKKNYIHKSLDYFCCVGFKHNTPKKIYLIPFSVAKLQHIRVSLQSTSKWEAYKIWE